MNLLSVKIVQNITHLLPMENLVNLQVVEGVKESSLMEIAVHVLNTKRDVV